MLVPRDAVTFCAFSTIREPTTAKIRLRAQISLCEKSLHEGKLVYELEIIVLCTSCEPKLVNRLLEY